jgi:hypothetical protein
LQGRINFTTLANLPEGAAVMSGTFFIHNKPAIILFDSGGTIASNQFIRHVPIKLDSKTIQTDLILLTLEGMDIILGMN